MKASPYSPQSPQMHINPPPLPPANHPIETPTRSQNPYFVYPKPTLPSPSNSTAGSTPYSPLLKQKLNFAGMTPKPIPDFTGTQIKNVVRVLKRRKMVSHGVNQGLNKLFYQLLPDGVICAYAAKGTPNSLPGSMHPASRSIQDTLKSDNKNELTINVTAVLPLKYPRTNLARKINYAKGTKKWTIAAFFLSVIT
jgi:hypothetical protein